MISTLNFFFLDFVLIVGSYKTNPMRALTLSLPLFWRRQTISLGFHPSSTLANDEVSPPRGACLSFSLSSWLSSVQPNRCCTCIFSICPTDFLTSSRDGSDHGHGFLGLRDPIYLWDPSLTLFFRGGGRSAVYGDVLVQGRFSLDCYVSLEPCVGEAMSMYVQVSSKGMMMVAAVDDGVHASQFRSALASSGTSLIRSSQRRPFDILFGLSEVPLGALLGFGVASSMAYYCSWDKIRVSDRGGHWIRIWDPRGLGPSCAWLRIWDLDWLRFMQDCLPLQPHVDTC